MLKTSIHNTRLWPTTVTMVSCLLGIATTGVLDLAADEATPANQPIRSSAVQVERGIEYFKHGDDPITLDWCRPAKPNGAAVLFIASDGWISHSYDPTPWMNDQSTAAGRLVADGFAFAVIRHRSGGNFTVPDAFDDVRHAVRFVRSHADRFQIDNDRIGVFGKSAGGHLALLVGTVEDTENEVSHAVKTTVAWSAPSDLRPVVMIRNEQALDAFPALRFDPEQARSVSPLAQVSANDASMLFIHGTNDPIVPLLSSEVMNTTVKLSGGESRFVSIEDAGHMFAGRHYDRAVVETVNWFQSQLLD